MIIAVDFDGTIHDGQWPRIGEAMPGAREAINALRAEGHYIIIWTCREGRQQTEMVNWLLEKGIGFDRINDHRPDEVAAYGSNARKVYAHCYVDDKNVGGMLPWKDIAAWIRHREAAYRGRLRTPAKFGRGRQGRQPSLPDTRKACTRPYSQASADAPGQTSLPRQRPPLHRCRKTRVAAGFKSVFDAK